MTITCALIQTVEKIARETGKARMITKARVTELIMSGGACTGRIYEKGGAIFKEFGPVIFTSGGFIAASSCPCKAEGQNFCTPDRTQYRIRSPRLAASFQMVLTRCEFCPVALNVKVMKFKQKPSEPNETVVDQAHRRVRYPHDASPFTCASTSSSTHIHMHHTW